MHGKHDIHDSHIVCDKFSHISAIKNISFIACKYNMYISAQGQQHNF